MRAYDKGSISAVPLLFKLSSMCFSRLFLILVAAGPRGIPVMQPLELDDDEVIVFKTTHKPAPVVQPTVVQQTVPVACVDDDDEDEVFFGAVTQSERQRAGTLQKRRRTMILVLPVRIACIFFNRHCN